ncbi:uncharacterized protein [Callorhinus ursinus]|uniref:uncharacterized protein isoform X2 n=2 Tax=Callorhinus ursinus TaxID=34884 RepID=UPI003CD007AE
MFSESRIGARASGLGSPARPLGALTRRALILRPPPRPESPPLSAQGHTAPSPPRESQATPSARRVTALAGGSVVAGGVWGKPGKSGCRIRIRAIGVPRGRSSPAPRAKRSEASICYSEFLLVQVERGHTIFQHTAESTHYMILSSPVGIQPPQRWGFLSVLFTTVSPVPRRVLGV